MEAERLAAAQGDNKRERGLIDMMDGVLELKKEDILKQVITFVSISSGKEHVSLSGDWISICLWYLKTYATNSFQNIYILKEV